jgi:hypothetical protein
MQCQLLPTRLLLFSFGLYRFQEEGPFKVPTPKARSGHRIVYYKGSIYSFGGYNPKVCSIQLFGIRILYNQIQSLRGMQKVFFSIKF